MTNFEKYKDEIQELAKQDNLAFDNEGKLRSCRGFLCSDCMLNEESCYKIEDVFNWLFDEYIEQTIELPDDTKIDTPIMVSMDGKDWVKRYFAGFADYEGERRAKAYRYGATSWSTLDEGTVDYWKYAKLVEA